MIFVIMNDINGITQTGYLYQDTKDFIADIWNPDDLARVDYTMGFTIKGKTYQERKENLYNIILDFMAHDIGGLSYYETFLLQDYFETNARRYGLTKELKENCII